ncbi:MAG: ABC transporter ATP-binding protein, partial [Eubacteriales bacterium]|nr:ABC transporter ATP-binding protein [Eubacteriales bacterium]
MAKEKIKKEKPKKPKYNMWQNSCWMIGTAWKIKEKKVIFICLAQVIIALGQSLVSLFISPAVISAVETQKSLTYLLVTILVFIGATMLLNCANSYVGANAMYGRLTIRTHIIGMICGKMMTTSYPNTEKKEFRDLAQSASNAVGSNRSATEAIWNTLVQLIKNVLGFAIYLAMLSRLDFWVVAVVLATSIVGFFVNKKVGGFGYRHRMEFSEQGRRMNYVNTVGSGSEYAKDMRIFGIKPWLTEIYDKAKDLTLALKRKEQNVNMISSFSDIVLTFLRNGIAYAYLINMALKGNLSAAEFVLYFAAFSGFTNWV